MSDNSSAALAPATAQDTPANVSLEDRQLIERNLTIVELPSLPIRHFDADFLNEPITQSSSLVHRNSFFLGCVATYMVDKRNHGIALLGDLYNDFTGWSYDDFELINPRLRSRLRTLLRIRGIYMGKANSSISRALCGLLTSNELPEWDENELLGQEVAENTVAYKVKQKLLQGTVKAALSSPAPVVIQQPTITRPAEPESPQIIETHQPAQQEPQHQWRESPRYQQTLPVRTTNFRDAYTSIPPVRFENEEVEADLTIRFIKIWDKKLAYTGEPYDIFDDKIRKFMSVCRQANIPPSKFHGVFPSILAKEAQSFFLHEISTDLTFAEMYQKMKEHFDTEINQKMYHTDWSTLTFSRLRAEMPGKSSDEVLQALLTKLRLCRRALGDKSGGEGGLIDATLKACRGVPEFRLAIYSPAPTFEGLASQLRSSLSAMQDERSGQPSDQYSQDLDKGHDQNFVDRKFQRNSGGTRDQSRRRRPSWKKKCYVCGKKGCFSTKHPENERKAAKEKYLRERGFHGHSRSYAIFLANYEGESQDQDDSNTEESDDSDSSDHNDSFYTAANFLSNEAFRHRVSPVGITSSTGDEAIQFVLDRYSQASFQGIMPDTGAACISTGGIEQLHALQREMPSIKFRNDRKPEPVRFGAGRLETPLGVITLNTPVGEVDFHIVNVPTPFLLCLADMDRLGVYLNNVTNELVGNGVSVPVIRRWGHAWFFLRKQEASVAFLTEAELRRLHTRFGHPSVYRLHKLLNSAGHNVEIEALEMIKKFCHYCQMKSDPPRRFKFSLKDDCDFNYEVIVDIMTLDGKPVLHIVDQATAYQAGRFLSNMTAKETWLALKQCWMDTYLGPPDVITHDAGTNFAAAEFQAEAKLMGITCHQVPVEAHWAVGKVERYHVPVRRAYDILKAELKDTISPDQILQMAFKAVNDTAGPDGLVPTLLVFGALPRMTIDSPPTPSAMARAKAVWRTMSELRKINAQRKVQTALNTRNGPDTALRLPLCLPLGSEVRVFREKHGWQGPYKVLEVTDTEIAVDLDNGPAKFRSTCVQPYYRHPESLLPQLQPDPSPSRTDPSTQQSLLPSTQSDQQQPLQNPLPLPPTTQQSLPLPITTEDQPKPFEYPEPKRPRRQHLDLAKRLRAEGKIKSPGFPFEAADTLELTNLLAAGVIVPEEFDVNKHGGHRVFKSRMVREVKGRNTASPYEKSRLVVQGYNDDEKRGILTQAPTISRPAQRVALALSPFLCTQNMSIMIRDITMAYTQSQTRLNRTILAALPQELRKRYPEGTILRIVKPLYGIAEAGAHWFNTYHDHHCRKLNMETSSFDPCLLITANNTTDKGLFGIAALQTDDTFIVGTDAFLKLEEKELCFKAKPKEILQEGSICDFNGNRLSIQNGCVIVRQRGQVQNLEEINLQAPSRHQDYVAQRARGAYIASVCQPEATYDYSIAAQAQEPVDADFKVLNKRIDWQISNPDRGLHYIPIDLENAKIFVFTDGSFANNKDLSSQIGFVIIIANETAKSDNSFSIRGNILHWSSTKCKRVTRSVLASEIYGLTSGFDLAFVIRQTVNQIAQRLDLKQIPLVICTDSYSLYECLVKLGTTTEKRLMIDIMALRQAYESRDIAEIRWVNGADNPADAMTKASPNGALTQFISDNQLNVRVEGFVHRDDIPIIE
ncbi:hypothetical protein HIM_00339 [Hirsutella minnesotensis 3608]|nr:hypothetical protein HIM_00339 [Hirsutella minnesotensis 3608]